MLLTYVLKGLKFLLDNLVTFVFFLLLPLCLTVVAAWLINFINLELIAPTSWLKSFAMILGTFISGALIGKKMNNETGGLMTFFLAILAFSTFSFLTFTESRGIEIISGYFPLMQKSAPSFLYLLLPGVGLLGIVMFKFVTFNND